MRVGTYESLQLLSPLTFAPTAHTSCFLYLLRALHSDVHELPLCVSKPVQARALNQSRNIFPRRSYSWTRLAYFDWCKYTVDKSYESQTADAKAAWLWGFTSKCKTPADWQSLANLFMESVKTIFDDVSDIMPAARTKVIHSVGVVATVAFEPSGEVHPFSGLFKTGAKAGWSLQCVCTLCMVHLFGKNIKHFSCVWTTVKCVVCVCFCICPAVCGDSIWASAVTSRD
jgi:hypothetical protein